MNEDSNDLLDAIDCRLGEKFTDALKLYGATTVRLVTSLAYHYRAPPAQAEFLFVLSDERLARPLIISDADSGDLVAHFFK